jgi:hypothetical protein
LNNPFIDQLPSAKEKTVRKIISIMLTLTSVAVSVSRAQNPVSPRPDSHVLKILAIGRPGNSPMTPEIRERTLPIEVRETVKLYLAGKIDQWYFRKDNGSVVFILNVTTTDEARSLLESLPFGKAHILTFDYVPLSPLVPLRLLVNPHAQLGPTPMH